MSPPPSRSPTASPSPRPPPRLVASTGKTYQCSISKSNELEAELLSQRDETCTELLGRRREKFTNGDESNVFKSAAWSPDGTCVLTCSEDGGLRTFVIPVDLLEPSPSPKPLLPFSTIHTAEPTISSAIHPTSSLSAPSSACFLASTRDHPIHLYSLLYPSMIASYPNISPTSERFQSAYSLLFLPNSTRFAAGSCSEIAFFDTHRPGEGPVLSLKTIPSRKAHASATCMKGIVSALSHLPGNTEGTGVLAAGTFSRHVGLYAGDGTGEGIGVFRVGDGGGSGGGGGKGGKGKGSGGITQLLWSGCGRYLYIAERKSEVIHVYDIRVSGEKVESFSGRNAFGNQRLGIDVFYAGGERGGDVVGGGADGVVRVWEPADHHHRTGEKEAVKGQGVLPKMIWKAHEDPVTSTAVHPTGCVIATASGERKMLLSGDGSSSEEEEGGESGTGQVWDNSLKIWVL